MIRKYHNHKPQTTPWHREKEPLNITRQQEDKLSKVTSSLFPIKMIVIQEWTKITYNKNRTITYSHNGSNNKQKSHQQQNHRLRMDSNLSHWVGLNAFYWYQIFALDSAVVDVQEMFSSHRSLLTIAMYHHGETL